MNQLKEAERKATQLVQDARKARTDRLKDAKIEAEQLIASYRAEMEASYKEAQSKVNSKNSQSNTELQNQTTNDINGMNREYSMRKIEVQKLLINMVLRVEPKAPEKRK